MSVVDEHRIGSTSADRAARAAARELGERGLAQTIAVRDLTGSSCRLRVDRRQSMYKHSRPGRSLGVFVAVLAAIVVAVFLFFPDRLPIGVGLKPVPLKASLRPALLGPGQVAVLSNPTAQTIHNVRIVCRNDALDQQAVFVQEEWKPGQSIEIGWAEGWAFQNGETISASASGFSEQRWTVR
jgi:hypothetical protein